MESRWRRAYCVRGWTAREEGVRGGSGLVAVSHIHQIVVGRGLATLKQTPSYGFSTRGQENRYLRALVLVV